jgi:hypothetical protein
MATNALAYYGTEIVTAVKGFISVDPCGACPSKLCVQNENDPTTNVLNFFSTSLALGTAKLERLSLGSNVQANLILGDKAGPFGVS